LHVSQQIVHKRGRWCVVSLGLPCGMWHMPTPAHKNMTSLIEGRGEEEAEEEGVSE